MMNSSEKDVNEILASVINENPMIFEVDGLELLVNPDILNFKDELCVAINPYVLYFYEELSKKVDLTYGLLLGLTKRFFEFSLKRIVSLYKYGDIEKINEMKYNIANIYYMTFKKEEAKGLLLQIEKEPISNELRVKVYNALANLTNNYNKAYEYYEKALKLDLQQIDKDVLAELYYKFGLANEYNENEKQAAIYYKKCIDLKDTQYLSNALSNIATLYDDIGESNLAIKYYYESLNIDKQKNNLNGIYASSMKLAEIYSPKDTDKAIHYFNEAINSANKLQENFYIVSATTALGDFYFNRNENSLAYKNYKIALDLVNETKNENNYKKIQERINDIRIKIGEERFKNLAN